MRCAKLTIESQAPLPSAVARGAATLLARNVGAFFADADPAQVVAALSFSKSLSAAFSLIRLQRAAWILSENPSRFFLDVLIASLERLQLRI